MSLDSLLGTPPYFYINGKSRQGFNRAWLVLVFFACLFMLTIFYLSQDLFFREDPSVRISTEKEGDPGELFLSTDDFNIGIGISSPAIEGYVYEPEVITPIFWQWQVFPDEDGNTQFGQRFFTMVPCDKSHFKAVGDDFDTFPLDLFFCIDPKEVDGGEASLRGFYQSGLFNDVRVIIQRCVNDTVPGVTCLPDEEINRRMNGAYIDMLFVHKTFEPTDYDHPVKNFGLQTYTFSSEVLTKQVIAKIQNNYIETDYGLIGEDLHIQKYPSIKEQKELISGPSNMFFELTLNYYEEKVTYRRTYVKLQEILAELDGFITFVIFLLVLIFIPIVRVKYFQNLISSVYDTHLGDIYQRANEYHDKMKEIKSQSKIKEREKVMKKLSNMDFKTSKSQKSHMKKKSNFAKAAQQQSDSFAPIDMEQSNSITPFKKDNGAIDLNNSDEISLDVPDDTTTGNQPFRVQDTFRGGQSSPGKNDDNNGYSYSAEERLVSPKGTRLALNLQNCNSSSPSHKLKLGRTQSGDSCDATTTPGRRDSFFKIGNNDSIMAEFAKPEEKETPKDRLLRIFKLVLAKTKKRLQEREAKRGNRGGPLKGAKGLKNLIFDLLEANKEQKKTFDSHKDGKKGHKQGEYKQNAQSLLKFNECDVWAKIFCCIRGKTKEKFEFLRFGTQSIRKELDMTVLLRKLRQFDKLKELVLTKEQLAVFDDLKRPNLLLEQMIAEEPDDSATKVFSRALKKRKSMFRKENELNPVDCFIRLQQKPKKTETDLKLIKMYEKNNLNRYAEFEYVRDKITGVEKDVDEI